MTLLVDGAPVESFVFPGGECHVRLAAEKFGESVEVFARLASSEDVMRLLLAVDAIRRIAPAASIRLTVPYVPYARQDRVCNPGEALGIRVMTKLINDLACASVTIFDPHSDVTPALIDRCRVLALPDLVSASPLAELVREERLALVAPDAGARKKIDALAARLGASGERPDVFYAEKARDVRTGAVVETTVRGDVLDRDLLVVDDICDGGRTFVALAEALRARGARSLRLYVTHGIFSQGLAALRPGYRAVFCYHVLRPLAAPDDAYLTVLAPSSPDVPA